MAGARDLADRFESASGASSSGSPPPSGGSDGRSDGEEEEEEKAGPHDLCSRVPRRLDPRALNPSRRDRQRGLQAVGEHDGWFAIGLYRSKHLTNHDTLWRGAWHMGASFLFLVGDRLGGQVGNADTSSGWLRLPSLRFHDFDALFAAVGPEGASLVAVEMGGEPLEGFRHPRRAVYLLGAEDQGLPPSVVARCTHHVELPTIREASMNVACCGAVVMYDREQKRRLGILQEEESPGLTAQQADRYSLKPSKQLHAGSGWGDRASSTARWRASKRRALEKAAQHHVRQDAEIERLRAVLDADADCFASFALPPAVHVLVEDSELHEQQRTPRRVIAASAAEVEGLGCKLEEAVAAAAVDGRRQLRVRFAPLLVHVRCRDLRSAHRLLKEADGLVDASVTSLDAAKVVVCLRGRGREVEHALGAPAESSSSPALATLAAGLQADLWRAAEELVLLRTRLQRASSAASVESEG